MTDPRRRYTVREIAGRSEWNTLVQRFAACDLRQGFEWGALRTAHGWRAARLAAFDDDGACAAACALLSRGLPVVGSVMYAPRGPLWRGDGAGLRALLGAVRTVARGRRAAFVRLSPGGESPGLEGILSHEGFVPLDEQSTTWNTPRVTQRLDLSGDDADLLRRVRRRFRDHIAGGARKGLTVEAADGDADLLQFHRMLVETGRRKGIPVRDRAYYRRLVQQYGASGAVTLLVARAHGDMVGGILAVRFGPTMWMLHTSVRSGIADGLRHGVAPVIFWDFIRRAKAAGCDLIDLGSSGVQNPPQEHDTGYGVYRFKAGLGATLHLAPRYRDLVLRPLAYRAMRVGERRMLPPMWRLAAHAPAMAILRRVPA